LPELGLKTGCAEIHHHNGCSALMIRAILLSFALLIDWHLDVLASTPPFHAVSAVTEGGLAVCNPGPAMKQLPGTNLFVGRGMSIQQRSVCNSGAYTPKPFIGLFSFNWQTSQFVMQNYIQQFPAHGNGFTITSGYDPFTVSFHGEYWTAFECLVASSNQVSTCLAPLRADLSGMDLSQLTVPALGISGPNPAKPTQRVTLVSASAPKLLAFQSNLYLYWQTDTFLHTPMTERGALLAVGAAGAWIAGSGNAPVLTNDPHLTSLVYDVTPGDNTKDFAALLTDVNVTTDGSILAIGVVGGTSANPCITPKSVSKGCWRVMPAITAHPLAYNTFGQNPEPTHGIPENPFDYARIILDPQGTPWLFGDLQLPVGGTVPGYAPSESTVGVGYVPWLP
jgi:hypothetical protein